MDDQNNRKPGNQESTAELLRRLEALLDENWQADLPADVEPQPEAPQVPRNAEQSRKSSKRRTGGRSDAMILFHDLVYILAAVVLVFTFFIRMSKVEGGSMNPTLVNHARMLLLSNVWYDSPRRGDIVVARVPDFSKDPIVKRVIAVEGDTVDIDFDKGIVYVNGEALSEPYIKEPTYREFAGNGVTFPMVVDKGHVFLMGDNRNDSYDSRYGAIGQVDERCILGKAFFLTLPGADPDTGARDFSRLGLID